MPQMPAVHVSLRAHVGAGGGAELLPASTPRDGVHPGEPEAFPLWCSLRLFTAIGCVSV